MSWHPSVSWLSLYPLSVPSSDLLAHQFSLPSILLIISDAALPHMDTSHSLLHLLCTLPSPLLCIAKVCSASLCNPFSHCKHTPGHSLFSLLLLPSSVLYSYLYKLPVVDSIRQNEDSPFPALISVWSTSLLFTKSSKHCYTPPHPPQVIEEAP